MSILESLKAFFLGSETPDIPSLLMDRHGKVINKELAAAFTTLLVEIALSDEMFQENEVTEIVHFLREELALPDETAQHILTSALESRGESAKMARNLGPLALGLTEEQKEHLLELALRVAFADDRVSPTEELEVARVAELLRLSPEAVRQRVKEKTGR
jgi:uncharacterized tellurite resistance protein B-like protein